MDGCLPVAMGMEMGWVPQRQGCQGGLARPGLDSKRWAQVLLFKAECPHRNFWNGSSGPGSTLGQLWDFLRNFPLPALLPSFFGPSEELTFSLTAQLCHLQSATECGRDRVSFPRQPGRPH